MDMGALCVYNSEAARALSGQRAFSRVHRRARAAAAHGKQRAAAAMGCASSARRGRPRRPPYVLRPMHAASAEAALRGLSAASDVDTQLKCDEYKETVLEFYDGQLGFQRATKWLEAHRPFVYEVQRDVPSRPIQRRAIPRCAR